MKKNNETVIDLKIEVNETKEYKEYKEKIEEIKKKNPNNPFLIKKAGGK
jgi:hypothetical protein